MPPIYASAALCIQEDASLYVASLFAGLTLDRFFRNAYACGEIVYDAGVGVDACPEDGDSFCLVELAAAASLLDLDLPHVDACFLIPGECHPLYPVLHGAEVCFYEGVSGRFALHSIKRGLCR